MSEDAEYDEFLTMGEHGTDDWVRTLNPDGDRIGKKKSNRPPRPYDHLTWEQYE